MIPQSGDMSMAKLYARPAMGATLETMPEPQDLCNLLQPTTLIRSYKPARDKLSDAILVNYQLYGDGSPVTAIVRYQIKAGA